MSRTESTTLAAVPDGLAHALQAACPTVSIRATDRLSSAHDASHYLMTPLAVVTPTTAAEVGAVLNASRQEGVAVTFRSGGTSLSGQSVTGGVLIDTRRHFRSIDVLESGAAVRSGPGATVRQVNARLARHGRKLGPDPASEIACTIGGVVANNSSGMACGIEQNTYRTLSSLVLVLPSGTVLDTSFDDADDRLRLAEPAIHAGLLALRDRVRGDADAVANIRRQYSIKNTMGYGLNSFLDHELPIDILEHLVIGSEGTLAFIAEATFDTVELLKSAATGLLVFDTLAAATEALPALVAEGFSTIELLDTTSLRVAQRDPQATSELLALDVSTHAALLVEMQASNSAELQPKVRRANACFERLPLAVGGSLSTDSARRAQLWHIRKGLFTSVAGARPSGTTALLEDIAVPVTRLGETCEQLVALFDTHGYEESVIFGHAKDGNIHFMINERFDDPASLHRYRAFTEEMVDLVLANGGSLKAEHGTGRIMAPFVRRQFGDLLYTVMLEVKALIDPDRLLNPGVLLSDDANAHLHNLKSTPIVEAEVDRCVECGYCEPVCPSRDLTTTPRQRIVLRRDMERARMADDTALLAELEREYEYDGVETCAVDGMCQTACPVLINTGDLVRRLRAEAANPVEQAGWKLAAGQWDAVSRVGGSMLSLAAAVPPILPVLATRAARTVLGHDTMPEYSGELPRGGRRRPVLAIASPDAVYFASCTTTMFGPAGDGDGVAVSLQQLCDRAGVQLATPPDLPSLCCGTPWKSKGFTNGYDIMKRKVLASLRAATRDGQLPVVCDASSCTEGLQVLLESAAEEGIRVVDAVAFVDEHVLPLLDVPAEGRIQSLVLHPTCSSTRLGLNGALERVAAAAAEQVTVPDDWSCCAFAGDRGMLHPELTATATASEAIAVHRLSAEAHASVNRTCELGMTRATGEVYSHVLEVLNATFARAGTQQTERAKGPTL